MASHHIALPKSSLLRFSISGVLNFLDLRDNQIKQEFAKEYNAELDYYPDDTEKFLGREVETVLGRLYKTIDTFENNQSQFIYPDGIEEKMKMIIGVQLLRSQDMMKMVRENSIFGRDFNIPDVYFSPLHHGPDFSISNMTNAMKLFDNYEMNICLVDNEKCPIGFLLPSIHWFSIGNIVYFVLSPRYAIILLPKEMNDIFLDGDILKYLRLDKESDMKELYRACILVERKRSIPRLIGTKDSLVIAQGINKEFMHRQ